MEKEDIQDKESTQKLD